MRVYVASAFGNKAETREVQSALRADGHEITHDWTQESADHLQPGSSEWDAFVAACGRADFFGVITAHALVVVAHTDMSDTKAEMGIALGRGIPVFVLYPERRHSVFYGMTQRFRCLPELLNALAILQYQGTFP